MDEPSVGFDGADVVAASMDGVGIIAGTEYAVANDVLAEVHGYDTTQELIGRAWETLYSPEDGEATAGELLTRVREEGEWRGRASGHGRNGDRVPVELSMRATDDGIVCIVRDVTERRERERELRRERAFIENALGALDDVFYLFDEDATILRWSGGLEEKTGYTTGDLASMTPKEFIPPEQRVRPRPV